MSPIPSSARTSRTALAVVVVLGILGIAVTGCCSNAPVAVTVSQLLSSPELARGQEVRVAGWVVAASTATDSRAVFYLADQPGSDKRLKVDYRGAQPPVSESVVPTVGSWPGRYVLVTGTFDGKVFETADLVVRNDHSYRESTSQPVSP